MNERLGAKMQQATIEALLDMFSDDPGATVATVSGTGALEPFLDALLKDVPRGIDWMYLLRMANSLPSNSGADGWFQRIIRAANNELRRKELLVTLVAYGKADEDDSLLRLEAAIASGIFDEVIVHTSRTAVEELSQGRLARPIVVAHATGRIQRFLESGDPKRAYDELIAAATLIPGWRPPQYEKWVERVWQAHRDKNLVADLTNDPKDWRNNDWPKTMRFGQNRTGFRTTKPHKPTVNYSNITVPLSDLWRKYVRPPTDAECALDWPRRTFGRWRNNAPNMVNTPGNMIRDMAWYWHNEAKERKLREFCDQHQIPYPAPT